MLHHMLRATQKKLTALSYIQRLANTSTSPTTLSATPQSGDLLIYSGYTMAASVFPPAPTNIIPSGFTQICTHYTNGITYAGRSTLAYKIANGTESSLSGMQYWTIEQFRGNLLISAVTVAGSGGGWSTFDPGSSSITGPTSLPALALGFAKSWNDSLTFDFSHTGETVVNLTDATNQKYKYIIYAASGGTLSANPNDAGDFTGYSAAILTLT